MLKASVACESKKSLVVFIYVFIIIIEVILNISKQLGSLTETYSNGLCSVFWSVPGCVTVLTFA